jgi:hypothetical protein
MKPNEPLPSKVIKPSEPDIQNFKGNATKIKKRWFKVTGNLMKDETEKHLRIFNKINPGKVYKIRQNQRERTYNIWVQR